MLTAQLHRPIYGEDSYGRSVAIGFETSDLPVRFIDPGKSVEPRDGSSRRVVTEPVLYLAPGAEIRAEDEITVGGVRYGVEGTPKHWHWPGGGGAGVVVYLRGVKG